MSPEIVNGVFAISGAIIGALLTGIISWIQAKRHAARTELAVFITRPSRLIEVDSTISQIVTITIANHQVPTVYTLEIMVLNSGTETLHNVEIHIDIGEPADLLAIDGIETNDAIQPDDYRVAIESTSVAKLVAEFLNPGDEILLQALLSDEPRSVNARFRQPGVALVTRYDFEPAFPGIVTRAFYEAIRTNYFMHAYFRLVLPSYRRYLEHEAKMDSRSD